jgi:hypothetical protein
MNHAQDKRQMLRHFLGALAYRTQKALRGRPPGFDAYRAAAGVRTPHELVWHMSSVLGYARTRFTGGTWRPRLLASLDEELERFHAILGDLRDHLDGGTPLRETTPERMLQGPFADAMTHAGQLAMLRRLFGAPVPPEDFIDARVDGANVGADQPAPASPDERWYSAEEEPRGTE